jgi:hypothetical protein
VPVEKGIYFISGTRGHNGRSAIEFYDVTTGRRKALTMIERTFSCGVALSPDGGSLVHPLVDQVSSNLMLVENFR